MVFSWSTGGRAWGKRGQCIGKTYTSGSGKHCVHLKPGILGGGDKKGELDSFIIMTSDPTSFCRSLGCQGKGWGKIRGFRGPFVTSEVLERGPKGGRG